MESLMSQVVEIFSRELPPIELVDLPLEELEHVAGGIGDPGIIEVEK